MIRGVCLEAYHRNALARMQGWLSLVCARCRGSIGVHLLILPYKEVRGLVLGALDTDR